MTEFHMIGWFSSSTDRLSKVKGCFLVVVGT